VNFENFIIYVHFCNSRIYVITLYSGHVCDGLCVIASVMVTHNDTGVVCREVWSEATAYVAARGCMPRSLS
jgi:hypothetical protein